MHTEAIANPTTEVADIGALAEIAHAGGALLSVDSTFFRRRCFGRWNMAPI